MKINGKELKDIIKDGVLEVTGDLQSIKVSKVTNANGDVVGGKVVQDGNIVGDSIEVGNMVQNISGVYAKGSQFGCIGSGSFSQRIVINGEEVPSGIAQGIQMINVTGNVGKINSAGRVNVEGDVNGPIDSNGNVKIKGSVTGKIDANGRVECGDITGDVDSNGRIECGNVGGDVEAMGKVSMRR